VQRSPNLHASFLVRYFPVTKVECFTKQTRSKASADLFHYCMGKIVGPLKESGNSGIKIGCADGLVRLCFLLLAAYIADNPEQCLIACVKHNTCHCCNIGPDKCGDHSKGVLCDPDRTLMDLLAKAQDITTTTFISNGLNPISMLFWAGLPHTDIFQCLTPDLLH
jgi:hypothetical protein